MLSICCRLYGLEPVSAEPALRLHFRDEGDLTNKSTVAAGDGWGELLAAAQRGDAEAYRTFLVAIIPYARALARRRRWSEDRAEDIVQDVLLTVHRVRHTYQPGLPVKPWLAAIITRRSIDAIRKSGRIAAMESHNPIAVETYADPDANNEAAGESRRDLKQMMSALSPAQREALDLVKLQEMSLVEASAASGQSISSLKVNIHRAMKKLRLKLGKEGPE